MNPFGSTCEALVAEFSSRDICVDAPGFCDDQAFLNAEQRNPHYLNHYAAFVAKQRYDADYLAYAKATIDKASTLLHLELVKHGRLGACVDISSILFRLLEEEKIWSCCIKGSLTITFPREAEIQTKYFWSVDHGEFVAGHAWLFAPPYMVVDVTVQQQPYKDVERNYIPPIILTKENTPVTVQLNDIVSPSARAELNARGIAPDDQLEAAAKLIPDIHNSFPVIVTPGLNGASLKYSPVAIHAPIEKLRGLTNMRFRGKTPWELYRENFS